MADEKPIPRWRRLTETEELLASKDQTKAIKAQTKQAKEQHSQAKTRVRQETRGVASGPRVELGKETRKDILAALRNIRSQIVISQQRENTAADVAAEHLAGGGGIVGAAGAAVGFQGKKLKGAFKRKFDPLNIIHRLTGSKLATVLAGKVMGRSERAIRSAAGLQTQMEAPAFGSPSPYAQGSESPSPVDSGRAITLLEKMARSLTKIEAIQNATFQLTKSQDDKLEDAAAEQKAEFHKGTATQVTKKGEPAKAESGGWFSSLMKLLMPALLALGAFLADKLLPLFGKLAGAVEALFEGLWKVVKFMGVFTGKVLSGGLNAVKGVAGGITQGVKGLAGKIMGVAAPAAGTAAAAGAGAVAKGAVTGGKIAATVAPKAIGTALKGPVVKEVIKKIGTSVLAKTALKVIPLVGLGFAVKNLIEGQYTQAAIDAAMGIASAVPGVGSAAAFATGLTATIANQAYKEMYGLEPLSDPKRSERMPELVKESTEYVKDFLSPKTKEETAAIEGFQGPVTPDPVGTAPIAPGAQTVTPTATTPTELPAPVPMTGQALNDSAEFQKAAATGASNGGSVNKSTINVKNNNVNSTTIHQRMASPRSSESSFLRSNDRGYAPA